MHRSRLGGFIIDCQTADLPGAAAFWGAALGLELGAHEHNAGGSDYLLLDGAAHALAIEVQQVQHPSRLHLDIETDDVEAEVRRLEGAGATRVEQVRTWWVMQAPTGQRFCVIKAKPGLEDRPGTRTWP
jgi:catechol 2,3-dioxygenase-like lactoylglutathione lyase family enzyme